MALETYRAKRRFGVTAEPRGKAAPAKGQAKGQAKGHAFVIQKHAATRLHYDLRLELDGVMLSWAVTRGPSLVPGEKRLAIQVEDHPIEYNKFEGTIPKGEYGGGTVMIWDRGVWMPQGDPHFGLKKGHLEFRLEGEKLHGAWHLVRMSKRTGERKQPWLLIKASDDAERSPKDPDILEEMPLSVATGRTMDDIAAGKKGKAVWHSNRPAKRASAAPAAARTTPRPRARKTRAAAKKTRSGARKSKRAGTFDGSRLEGARRSPLPDFVPPCLALLSDNAPDGTEWLHEIKFDGYRMQARLADGEIALKTRKGLDWTEKFRPIAVGLAALQVQDALIDGEIVVETGQGLSSFNALQEALKSGSGTFVYYAFDLLHLDGWDVRDAAMIARKQALWDVVKTLPSDSPVRYSEHLETDGSTLLAHACKLDLEGIVSKRRDAPYRSGRGGAWLKTKCSGRQEFVIIGLVPAANDPAAVGALIVGYYQKGALQYAGRVGTGFTRDGARDLWRRLKPLRVKTPPINPIPAEERGREGIWVEPRLVAEVDFRGWTGGQRLRHPSFKGLREDKAAIEIVREVPSMATTSQDAATARGAKPRRVPAKAGKTAKNPEPLVRLTNPDRVYWDDVGLTKQGLADYYAQVWDWIAPQVTGRVLSLVRCPEGASGQCFFQKHASAGLDDKYLRLVPEDGDKVIAIDAVEGLLALVQAGVLEVHVRGSRIERLDAADRIVFDLDPSPEVKWPDVMRAARDVRERLEALNLQTFLKTTGGKGLHVVVPIEFTPWEDVKAFTRSFAEAMAGDSPERYIAKASKQARVGKVFIDYLRNSREATAICAYSTRARPGATVATPIAWTELSSLKTPNRYTVGNLMQRLQRLQRDPWADMARVKQKLPKVRRS